MAGLFDPYQTAALNVRQRPLPAEQTQGGLFADPTALGLMGSYLLAAGAPSTDPGQFGRTMAQMGPAMAQYRQNQAEAQALAQHRRQQIELQRQRLNQPVSVGPGASLVDPKTNEAVFTAPTTPKRTSRKLSVEGGMVQDQESTDGGKTWRNVGQPYLRRDPWKQITTVTPEGGVQIGYVDTRTLPGGQQQTTEAVETPEGAAVAQETTGPTIIGVGEKPPTVDQSKASGFYDRMRQADAVLTETGTAGRSIQGRVLEEIPGGNYLQTERYQMFEQARRDFINAVLRRESGAVISQEEFDNADRQYFPQPGDSDKVVQQKSQNRKTVIESMRRDARRPLESGGWKIERVD